MGIRKSLPIVEHRGWMVPSGTLVMCARAGNLRPMMVRLLISQIGLSARAYLAEGLGSTCHPSMVSVPR